MACQWIEPSERLIKNKQIRLSSERQSKRELGLLTSGEPADSAIQRYVECRESCFSEVPIEVLIQVGRDRQHRANTDMAIQRRFLCNECDTFTCTRRSCRDAAEHGDLPNRWRGQSDNAVEKRGLTRTVRTYECDNMTCGYR